MVTSTKEFLKILSEVDWYYEMTDDMCAYCKGEEGYKRAKEISEQNEEFFSLFNDYAYAVYNNTEKPVA